jgi:predicted nucleic acid-binding protein
MVENIENVFVVDATFVLAFLLREDSKTEEVFLKYKNGIIDLISSSLLTFEVGNSLRSNVLKKRISKKQAVDLFITFLDMNIIEKTLEYIPILDLALSKHLSFYDASYLYLANTLKLPLLTLDSSLKNI